MVVENHVIQTCGLSKRFGRLEALSEVNLTVPAGCLFGLLGPNGAGKTTLIRIMMGLLRPSAGRAAVFGIDTWRDGPNLRRGVGYLPGDLRLYDHMTVRATIDFAARARGCCDRTEIERLAARFDLDLDRRVREASRGMKQKLGLILAMMHRPALLVLDEPTAGLDPLVRRTLYDELREAASQGRTVLFSSHTLSEVDQLCDHVAILRKGRLIEDAPIETLRQRAIRRVEILYPQDGRPRQTLPDALRVTERREGYLSAAWAGPVTDLLAWLAGEPVQDVMIGPPDLEDLFLTYYADATGGGGP